MKPQEYMDLPYAGQAASKLAEDGLWDEDGGKPLIEYEVEYETTERDVDYIFARSVNEICNILSQYGQTLINAKEVK